MHKEVTIIYVLVYLILVFLIFNLISYFNVKKKSKIVLGSEKVYNTKSKTKFFNSYINKIESKLFNLEYPYKLKKIFVY